MVFLGMTVAVAPGSDLAFNRDIRPILAENCFACHGFDAKKRKSEMRLDTEEGAFGKGESGAVIIKPNDLKGSELWARINTHDRDEIMPPPKSHKTLSVAEKAILRRWIEGGARYEKHWAFVPPVRPAVPGGAVENPLDAFIIERLKPAGLVLSSEAERDRLLRRERTGSVFCGG